MALTGALAPFARQQRASTIQPTLPSETFAHRKSVEKGITP